MALILRAWPIWQSGCRRNAMEHSASQNWTPSHPTGVLWPGPLLSSHHTGAVIMQDGGKSLLAPSGRLKWYHFHDYLSPYLFVWNMLCFLSLTPQGDTPARNVPSNIQLSKPVTQSLTCIVFVKQTSCCIRSTNPRDDTAHSAAHYYEPTSKAGGTFMTLHCWCHQALNEAFRWDKLVMMPKTTTSTIYFVILY